MEKSYRNGWAFPAYDKHFINEIGPRSRKSGLGTPKYQQNILNKSIDCTIREHNCVVDVGANVGLFTYRYQNYFKNIHAFEPVTHIFECLEENVGDHEGTHLYNVGLGKTDEFKYIKLPSDGDNIGQWSLVDFNGIPLKNMTVQSERVRILPLDTFGIVPDLIKVDIQGFEHQFLLGAEQTIQTYRPTLQLEMVTPETDRLLKEWKYMKKHRVRADVIYVCSKRWRNRH